ncbi:MAG: c-type cytochrome, partial [Gammaproteobacteria bacterium]|nr:c-type cytochrome [Gammaproteobacteria bacterium]
MYRCLGLAAALSIHAANPAHAFTAEQAAAGRAGYEQHCSICHGVTLRQLPDSILAGREFVAKWGNREASELIEQVRTTMPPTNPGGLDEQVYVDVVAFMLQANGGAPSMAALSSATTALIGDGLSEPSAATAALLFGGDGDEPVGVTVQGTVENFVLVTDQMLRDPAPGDWLMIRRDYRATSYSPLD